MINEKEIYGRVYKITNLINGKQYVGQTVQTIKERFKNHYKGSKYSKNKMVIEKAISKYGKENFKREEIAVAYTQEQLTFSEGFYINLFKTLVPNGYNVKNIINGKGKHSEETIEKMKIKANTPERLKISSENGKKSRGIKHSEKSQYIGISKRKNRKYWRSSIRENNKNICLGTFLTEEDAAKAYDIAAIKYFGNDCNLNFPELRDDYINNKIHVEKNTKSTHSKSSIPNIWFSKGYWFVKKNNKSKYFKNMEDAIKYNNSNTLEDNSKNSVYYIKNRNRWRFRKKGYKEKIFKTKEEAEKYSQEQLGLKLIS